MKGKLDFPTSRLEIDDHLSARLGNLPSGHISLPDRPLLRSQDTDSVTQRPPVLPNYPILSEPALKPVTDAELTKIHKHLAHCGEYDLTDLLKDSHRIADSTQIRRIMSKCTCHGVVGRSTPPEVADWMGRFHGEIIGIDIIHPFMDIRT